MSRVVGISASLLRIAAVGAAALLVLPASADVFKFVDEKGNVQYTDRPQKLPAQRLNIQTQRTDVLEVENRTQAELKELEERAKARSQTQQAAANQQQANEKNAAGKVEACNKAREEYRVRANNFRLFENLPNGERRYLDAAEVDAARDSAKRVMDDLCAGL